SRRVPPAAPFAVRGWPLPTWARRSCGATLGGDAGRRAAADAPCPCFGACHPVHLGGVGAADDVPARPVATTAQRRRAAHRVHATPAVHHVPLLTAGHYEVSGDVPPRPVRGDRRRR